MAVLLLTGLRAASQDLSYYLPQQVTYNPAILPRASSRDLIARSKVLKKLFKTLFVLLKKVYSLKYKYTVSFGDVYIPNPTILEEDRKVRKIFPSEARQKDLTYDSPIFVDIKEVYQPLDGIENLKAENIGDLEEFPQPPEITFHKRIKIGKIPIMLRSEKCNLTDCDEEERIKNGECKNDNGGYFIIKGKERVLVGQLRAIYNQPTIRLQKEKSGEKKYKYVCDVRSMSEETGHSVLTQVKIGSDNRTLVFSIQYIKEVIPVGIVFKALGFLKDEEIAQIVGDEENKEIKIIN